MYMRLLGRLAWRVALPRAAAAAPRIVAPVGYRSLSVSAIALKKKKGSGGSEPPAGAASQEAQFDPDAIAAQMRMHADKCREAVQGLVGSFGRVDACA